MVTCPNCGNEFEHIGKHWSGQKCDRPPVPNKDIVRGLLMGDGSIPKVNNGNPFFQVQMTNRRFLEWLGDEFTVFGKDILVQRTEEQSTEVGKSKGWTDGQEAEYKPYYDLKFVRHPDFARMRERWYPRGQKRFPDSLELSPDMVKMWYVGDGTLDWREVDQEVYGPRVQIAATNEADRSAKLKERFRSHGFEPWVAEGRISFNYQESQRFLKWIGEPVPGFEHKWETESIEEYRKKRNNGI